MVKSQIHLNIDDDLKKRFEQCYPHCRSRFIENCLKKALTDRNFFDKVFFMELLTENKLGEVI